MRVIRHIAILFNCALGLVSSGQVQLAHYRFEGNGRDAMSRQGELRIWNQVWDGTNMHFIPPVFVDGTLSLTNSYDFADTPVLAGFSYDSFTVSLDFKAKDFGLYHNNILCGGYAGWLSFYTQNSGALHLAINAGYSSAAEGADFAVQVTTNVWHTLVCSIDWPRKTAAVYFDGVKLPVYNLKGTGFKFSGEGTFTQERQRQFRLEAWTDEQWFHGFVDNLRIFDRALTDSEVQWIYSPKVNVSVSNDVAVISWSVDLTGYFLEISSKLGNDAVWQRWEGTKVNAGDEHVVTEVRTEQQRFFRLSR